MKRKLVLCMGVSLLTTLSAQAKTFKVINPNTGQTLEVSCIFPSSVECQQKIEEAKHRVKNNMNTDATTLSGARWQDRANNSKSAVSSGYQSTKETIGDTTQRAGQAVRSGAEATGNYIGDKAQSAGQAIRGGAEATGNYLGDKAQRAGQAIRGGAEATGSYLSDKAQRTGDAIQSGAQATGDFLRDGYESSKDGISNAAGAVKDGAVNAFNQGSEMASSAYESAKGKAYKISIPGIDHSMTFHCHGGLESDECKQDQKEAEAAIRSGTTAKTLSEHRMQPIKDVGSAVANGAHRAVRSTANFLDRMSIKNCQSKLKRYAKDFDEQYNNSGQAHLVSYREKMSYIKKKLIDDKYFDSCESSFENAVLGNQLKIAAGKVEVEDTHIFDGLGRLPDGGVGYWKNEDRVESYQEFNRSISQ